MTIFALGIGFVGLPCGEHGDVHVEAAVHDEGGEVELGQFRVEVEGCDGFVDGSVDGSVLAGVGDAGDEAVVILLTVEEHAEVIVQVLLRWLREFCRGSW